MSKPKILPPAHCRSGGFVREVSSYICPVFLHCCKHLSFATARVKPPDSMDLWSDPVLPFLPSFRLHFWGSKLEIHTSPSLPLGYLFLKQLVFTLSIPVTWTHASYKSYLWLQKDTPNLTAGLSACRLVM